MENCLSYVKHLSEKIGPRGSATEKEKEAAEYLFSEMKNSGVEVSRQEFNSPKNYGYLYALFCFSYLITFNLYIFYPLLAIFLSILILLIFLAHIHTYEIPLPFIETAKSHNVLGKIPAKLEVKNKVLLVAHYDSSKAGLLFSPKFVQTFRFNFLLNTFSLFIIPILYLLGIFFKIAIFFTLPFLFCILLMAIFLIHREIFFTHTKGANDNASGVAVVLETGKYFLKEPLNFTEVYCLCTGAEEVGLIGMLNFLKKHQKEFKDAYFINLDNIGKGNLKYLIKEGMMKSYESNQKLVELTEEVLKENKEIKFSPHIFKIMLTDATACLVRNFKAMTIIALNENGLPPNWHWLTDTVQNIDEENLKMVKEFLVKIINKIDKMED